MCTTVKNSCQTISGYDKDGNPILKDKIKYDTHDKAVKACKTQNIRESRIKKLVTYKCKVCNKYHIGRNGKNIKAKYRRKLRRANDLAGKLKMKVGIKVIGKIDLTKFG
jgi:hypothetical protein